MCGAGVRCELVCACSFWLIRGAGVRYMASLLSRFGMCGSEFLEQQT
jgi:hypothetical protein